MKIKKIILNKKISKFKEHNLHHVMMHDLHGTCALTWHVPYREWKLSSFNC